MPRGAGRGGRVRLGPGAEFDLIRALVGAADPHARPGDPSPDQGVWVGPGDDCAVLEPSDAPWAVTVDMSVEGVHFRREWLSPEEIGWRAAAVSLSDLAATAAEPVAILIALALTAEDRRTGAALALQRGAAAAARAVGASVAGGDVTRSPGPLTIDVVALGRARLPILRSGARPGDEIWVTGRLGGAGAAVSVWERGSTPTALLRQAFAHPMPRVREALWLAETGSVRALIDLSDGIAGDVGHLAAASGCRIVVFAPALPIAAGVAEAVGGAEEALRLALAGGDDYELCLAAEAGALAGRVAAFELRFGIELTRIGVVVEGEGAALDRGDGSPPVSLSGGFDHFGRTGA
ncbi:MAG: thiamine-phosphate kinase [Gemmatimonadetes bacterium]|nr:thiamine-phosphate kinase [Gemmatimonadota bacterium]